MNERELFLSALEIKDPADRQAHLQAVCAGNLDKLSRVQALLASHESQSQFLNIAAVEQLVAGQPKELDSTKEDEAGGSAFVSNGPDTVIQNLDDLANEIPLGYLQPSNRPDSLGRLAHYEILEVVGRGAFGTVLKAFDEKLHRVVAIKVLSPEIAATSPARKRFLREARASAAIRHENVVSIYAVDERPIPYLVMEYIPGKTLQQRLDEHGPLDLLDVLRLGKQIAYGLDAAHEKQLIHRDVKPGNILLETGINDHVKITDFGLARAADDASMTQSGMIAGTPLYMAPEQALGQKLDQRADLFSLGSVLYQMLSGRPPFRAHSAMAVMKRVTEDSPRPLTEIIPEIPRWMCDIVSKLHAKNPDDRFQSAKEVADLLSQCESKLQLTGKVKLPKHITSPNPSINQPDALTSRWFSSLKKDSEDNKFVSRTNQILMALVALLLFGVLAYFMPFLSLLVRGRAYVECLTRDGNTRVDFYSNGELVNTQVGYGGIELPAGVYELRVSKPDLGLKIYDVAVLRKKLVLPEYDQVNLSSPPQNLRLEAGDQVGFMVTYYRETSDETKQDQTSSWLPLFNGRDLTGWMNHPDEKGNWHVEDGVLTGSGQPSYLFSTREFTNFHLRCEVRINSGGDGGIIIRAPLQRPTANGLPGYDIQIQAGQPILNGWQTGAISASNAVNGWTMLQPSSKEIMPDTWVPLEIISRDNHIETRVSGDTAVVHIDPQWQFSSGHIALQQSGSNTRVQFRNLEIRSLSSSGVISKP